MSVKLASPVRIQLESAERKKLQEIMNDPTTPHTVYVRAAILQAMDHPGTLGVELRPINEVAQDLGVSFQTIRRIPLRYRESGLFCALYGFSFKVLQDAALVEDLSRICSRLDLGETLGRCAKLLGLQYLAEVKDPERVPPERSLRRFVQYYAHYRGIRIGYHRRVTADPMGDSCVRQGERREQRLVGSIVPSRDDGGVG